MIYRSTDDSETYVDCSLTKNFYSLIFILWIEEVYEPPKKKKKTVNKFRTLNGGDNGPAMTLNDSTATVIKGPMW